MKKFTQMTVFSEPTSRSLHNLTFYSFNTFINTLNAFSEEETERKSRFPYLKKEKIIITHTCKMTRNRRREVSQCNFRLQVHFRIIQWSYLEFFFLIFLSKL